MEFVTKYCASRKTRFKKKLFRQSFNVNKFIQTTFHQIVTFWCWFIPYIFFIIFHWQYQMKKEVYFNINQLIWTTLHRLVRGTNSLFNFSLTNAHSVFFSSDRNKTALRFLFWLNIFRNISTHIKKRVT